MGPCRRSRIAVGVWRRTLERGSLLTVGLILIVAPGLGLPAPAGAAAAFPFAFLIEHGVQFEQFTDSNGMIGLHSGSHNVFAIVNGQKTSSMLGTATVVAWSRTVPDPFFAPFGPLVGLAILHIPAPFNLEVHLGLFQDSSGAFRTTIGGLGPGLLVDPTVRGTWVIANGTDVGGNADDLVIGGVWIAGTATPMASAALTLDQYFPTVPFPSDPTPTITHCVDNLCTKRLGAFYGQTILGGQARAVRSYTIYRQGAVDNIAHLLVVDVGGGDYVVVACSGNPLPGICTLSGVGSAGVVTGGADYASAGLSTILNLTPSLVLP